MNKQTEFLREKRYIRLTTEPPGRLLLSFSLLATVVMLAATVYSTTDTYFVSRLGSDEKTAAVGLVFPFISLIQALGFFFGYGSGNYIARFLVKRQTEQAEEMAVLAVAVSILFGLAITTLGLVFINPLIKMLGAGISGTVMRASKKYFLPIIIASPFMMGSLTIYNQFRLQGSSRDGTIGVSIGMLLNIVLDPIMIFTLKLGIAGAGWATCIGQVLAFSTLLYLSFRHGNVAPRLRYFKWNSAAFAQMAGGGMPNMIRTGVGSLALIILNRAAGAYGSGAVAAFTIANRLIMFAFVATVGIGQGFQPICGYNYNAGLYRRVKQAFYAALKVSTAMLLVLMAVYYFFAEELTAIMTNSPLVSRMGARVIRFQLISFPVTAFYVLTGMMLQNTGQFRRAAFVTAARQLLFFIPLALLLPALLGLNGLMLAQPVADILDFLLCVFYFRRGWRGILSDKSKIKQKQIACEEKR